MDASISDPADEQTHHYSESDLATIGDLAVWHLMPHLSIHRLTQLNCARWSMWDSCNFPRIVKSRTLDDTRDWYFPIIVKTTHLQRRARKTPTVSHRLVDDSASEASKLPVELSWSWTGVWHSSAQHASERALMLPPLTFLPHEWLYHSLPRADIIASAGGLLLIKGMIGIVPIRRSKRLNPVLADSHPTSTSTLQAGTSTGRISSQLPQYYWKRLLVCNPLTRECRELPEANFELGGLSKWQDAYWKGVQATLVVNEEANCYQVILTLRDFLVVYSSATCSWNCLRFPQERPWGRRMPPIPGRLHGPYFVTWGYHCGSACVGGRLYFADLQSTGYNAGIIQKVPSTLRLFEVDPEAGEWHAFQEYTLQRIPVPFQSGCVGFQYDMGITPYIEIVECMGQLHAVIPSRLHDVLLIGEKQSQQWRSEIFRSGGENTEYMPLCFYIMQLQVHGVDCGVMRIEVQRSRSDFQSRIQSLMDIASKEYWSLDNWFSCEARGSVIWVACEDYLLSFDLVSRKSRTQIIPMDFGTNRRFGDEQLGFSYRPSMHMKP